MGEEKIAVRCRNNLEWDKVKEKIGGCFATWQDEVPTGRADCINMDGLGWSTEGHYSKKGYTIISAQEYLNEEEFSVGDLVEILEMQDGRNYVGQTAVINQRSETLPLPLEVRFDCGTTWWYKKNRLKKLTTKPKTKTTEETILSDKDYFDKHEEELCAEAIGMHKDANPNEEEKTMDINKNVLQVFKEDAELAGKIAKRFGSQYDTTDRDTIALKRDKEQLIAIIKDEEAEEEK